MLQPAGGWFGCREMGRSFESSSSPATVLGAGEAGMALGKGKQPKEGATLLVLTPRRVLEGRCLSQGSPPTSQARSADLCVSDSGLLGCVVSLNQEFCVNRVAVEEFTVQTPCTGTEELMAVSGQIAWVSFRLISKPSPFKATLPPCWPSAGM